MAVICSAYVNLQSFQYDSGRPICKACMQEGPWVEKCPIVIQFLATYVIKLSFLSWKASLWTCSSWIYTKSHLSVWMLKFWSKLQTEAFKFDLVEIKAERKTSHAVKNDGFLMWKGDWLTSVWNMLNVYTILKVFEWWCFEEPWYVFFPEIVPSMQCYMVQYEVCWPIGSALTGRAPHQLTGSPFKYLN